MSKKMSIKLQTFFAIFGALMVGTGSWAVYSLINQGAGDLLLKIGIENVYAQMILVILVVLIGLLLSGASIVSALQKLQKGG